MRQKLILHIGTHKTGSTSIQNYFYYNRIWLEPMGVFYPRPLNGASFYTNNHKDLRDAARSEGKPKNPFVHPDIGEFDALLGRYVLMMKEAAQPYNILSCEGWSSHLNRYAHRLAPLSQHFNVKIVAFIRRPDIWVEKFYSQRIVNIEHKEAMTFDKFITQSHIKRYLFDRASMLDWWSDAFGPRNITLLPFEPGLTHFNLLERFMDASDLPKGWVRRLLLRHQRANRTLPPETIEEVRKRSEAGDPMNVKQIKALKRRAGINYGTYLTNAQRLELLKAAADDMARLTTSYVRDGRSTLFPETPELGYDLGNI